MGLAFVAAFLTLAILAEPASSATGLPFAPNVRVNDGTGTSVQDQVALAADPSGRIYAAWRDARNGDYDVYFATSPDGGRTYTTSRRMGGDLASGTRQEKPAIALGPSGTVVVAWQDDRITSFDYDIFASISTDYGATFSPATRVSDAPAGTYQFSPSAAVDSFGIVYVAWQDRRAGNWDLRLARSTTTPFLFGPSVRVDDDLTGSGNQSGPSLVVTSTGYVYVGYHDDRAGRWNANAYLAKSTDGGVSFGPSVRIDDAGNSATAQGVVSLAADSLGRIYAVWQDNRSGDFLIQFAKSVNGGASFSPSITVSNGGKGNSATAPRIAVGAGGTLYVAWEEGAIDWDIRFSYSQDGGATFAPSSQVDDAGGTDANPIPQHLPQVVESTTGLVTVLWQDMRNDNGDIYASTAQVAMGAALRAQVSLAPTIVAPGRRTDITVTVTSNGTPVDGATVTLTADYSGSFGSVTPLGSGSYQSSYTPSSTPVTGTVPVTITARATKAGFAYAGSGQALLKVMPGFDLSLEAPWDTLAVAQTMDVIASARTSGGPLAGATVTASTSSGATTAPSSGTTNASGQWKTTFKPGTGSGGTTQTLTVAVTASGYAPATATLPVTVLAKARALEITIASNRWEMMSWETANISVLLTSSGAPVSRAMVTGYCLRGGNFSAGHEWGGGSYSLTWDAPVTNSQGWASLVISAKVGGYVDARGKITILVDPNGTNPASPTQLYIMETGAAKEVRSGQSLVLLVYGYTKEGYVVSGAGLKASSLSSLAVLSAVVDQLNGRYTFTVTAGSVSVDTWISLKVEGGKYGYNRGLTRISIRITV